MLRAWDDETRRKAKAWASLNELPPKHDTEIRFDIPPAKRRE